MLLGKRAEINDMKLVNRIMFLIITVTLVTAIMIIYISGKLIKEGFLAVDKEWAESLVLTLSEGIAKDTINGNAVQVKQVLDAVVGRSEELTYAYVIDFDQNIFAHTFKEGFPLAILKNLPDQKENKIIIDNQEVYEVAYPIIDGMAAQIHLGINQDTDDLIILGVKKDLFVITIIIFFVVVIVTISFSHRITKPIEQLGKAMEQYSAKEFKSDISIIGGGVEITSLVEKFNNMMRRRLEAKQALQQFKSTLDQTLDCVFMFDNEEMNFSYVNKGASEQVGYSHDELMEMHPYDIKPLISEQKFRKMVKSLINGTASSLNFETIHEHKDGHQVPVEIFLQFIVIDDENANFVAIVRDVTERKKIELELSEYRDKLERRVEERTSEMKAARDEAQRANVAKSEFLSRMSHELRTPMNAILGFGQMLELDAEGFTDIQNKNVNEILGAGKHLLTLINEVLDLARIESGKLEVSMEKVHIEDVLHECLILIRNQAESKSIRLVVNTVNDDHTINADFTRLKQVFLNILSNAVKYNSNNGEIVITSEVINNDLLRISISDTGKGLAKEEIAKLFTHFERLDPDNNVEGTGIGLVITKHLVELMGGTIGVESKPGVGSKFWVEFRVLDIV